MTSVFRQLTIVLLVLTVGGCGTRKAKPNAEPSGAVDSSVVSSLPIPTLGELRWPTADRFDGGWVIAANLFPNGLNTPVGHRALYLAHSRSGLMALPEGDFLFAYPLVRYTPDGALHLFWSEGPASAALKGWPYIFTAVWHATFVGGRWTTPECVIRGIRIEWDSRAPQLVIDDSGRFHAVITATDSGKPEETYHLMRDAAGWHRQGMGMHVSYPALASLPGGRLVVVYVVGEQSSHASNQLYTESSSDYGRSWGHSTRVLAITDTAEVYQTQLRVEGDSLYLGWIGTQGKEGTSWSFSQGRITRGGVADSWTVPLRSPPLPGVLFTVTFAVNGCGDVRALAELLTPRMEPVVREIHAQCGRVVVEHPFGDAFAIAPLTDRSGDRIIQLWNAVRSQNDSIQPFFRELPTCR